jgi:hypothetical protein
MYLRLLYPLEVQMSKSTGRNEMPIGYVPPTHPKRREDARREVTRENRDSGLKAKRELRWSRGIGPHWVTLRSGR